MANFDPDYAVDIKHQDQHHAIVSCEMYPVDSGRFKIYYANSVGAGDVFQQTGKKLVAFREPDSDRPGRSSYSPGSIYGLMLPWDRPSVGVNVFGSNPDPAFQPYVFAKEKKAFELYSDLCIGILHIVNGFGLSFISGDDSITAMVNNVICYSATSLVARGDVMKDTVHAMIKRFAMEVGRDILNIPQYCLKLPELISSGSNVNYKGMELNDLGMMLQEQSIFNRIIREMGDSAKSLNQIIDKSHRDLCQNDSILEHDATTGLAGLHKVTFGRMISNIVSDMERTMEEHMSRIQHHSTEYYCGCENDKIRKHMKRLSEGWL